MNRAKTFGDFLIAKRMEQEMSARQLAIKLDFSAVYICDIEKTADPFPMRSWKSCPPCFCFRKRKRRKCTTLPQDRGIR